MEGEAFLWDGLEVIWLNHLSRLVLDSDFSSIQVCNDKIDSSQGLAESDFMLYKQISTLSLEPLVGLFLHDNDHVTGLLAWVLVCLAVECELAIVRSALIDLSINDFLLLHHLLSLARLALVGLVDDLALAATVIAGALRL